MSETVYTYSNIFISPYKFEKIINLKVTKELNEHEKLCVKAIIPEENVDKYVENADDNEVIEVQIRDKDQPLVLFKGLVTNIQLSAENNVRSITIEALSTTYLMDIKKKKRSFQNKAASYNEIFNSINCEYSEDVIGGTSQDKSIGELLVQYNETDWQFIKRLASHLNAPLVPDSKMNGIRYYVGVPELQKKYNINEFNYSIKKDLKNYKLKSENGIDNLDENDLISYEITTNKILDLCSSVEFKNRNLLVFRAEIGIENGVFRNKYILRDIKGFSRRTLYNSYLIGASLFGRVIDVTKDMVMLKLEIDEEKSSGAMWFPYSTVYSSPDGSGWYCMPEIGDKVRLYFPDEKENNAFAASSVNLPSSNSQTRSDPSVKSISTKYGKQIVFQPGAVEIIGNGKLLIRLTDDGGIEINSNKKITFSAAEGIEINGGDKILIQGEEGINLKQANASLNIVDNVTISGAKVNIE